MERLRGRQIIENWKGRRYQDEFGAVRALWQPEFVLSVDSDSRGVLQLGNVLVCTTTYIHTMDRIHWVRYSDVNRKWFYAAQE